MKRTRWLSLAASLLALLSGSGAAAAAVEISGSVAGDDGAPLAGAAVSLVALQSSHDWGTMVLAGRAYPEPAVQVKSDAAGRFRLVPPSVGLWTVVAEAPGRAPVQLSLLASVEAVELPPAILPRDAGAVLEIKREIVGAAGAPVPGAWVYASSETPAVWRTTEVSGWTVRPRFGVSGPDGRLQLPRAAGERLRISLLGPGGRRLEKTGFEGGIEGGKIAFDASAVPTRILEVRGADGKPAAGVQIRFEGFPVPLGATDAQGRVTLGFPAAGSLRVRLLAPDGRRSGVYVKPGEGPATAVLPASTTLTGRVLDSATRKPLAGALVWSSADPGAFSRTDAAGTYRIVPIEAVGRPRIQAEAAGHLSLLHRLDWRPGGPLRGPTLVLDPAASVSGQVVDAKGAPVAGALVQAVLRSGIRQRQFSRTGTAESGTATGADGRFRLARLMAGETWEIRALRPGYAASRLTLPALRSRSDLRLVLERGRNGFGRVVDRAEKPVTGAEIRLLASTGELSLVSERRPRGEDGIDAWQAATDPAGRFEVPSLPPGPLDLLVRKPGFAPVLVRAVPVPRGEGPFDLGTIILEPAVELKGRVMDREGKPVPGAEVHATRDLRRLRMQLSDGPLDRKADAVTDAGGRFTVRDLHRGDQPDLLVRVKGFLPGEVKGVTVPVAAPLTIVLDPATSLSGRVVDADGLPIAGAELALGSERAGEERGLLRFAARSQSSATSDEDGRFAFDEVQPGRAELRVTAEGFQPSAPETLTVPAGNGLDNLRIVLERGAVIEGRVTTTAGEPVGDTRVICGPAAAVSDGDGAYRLEGVPPGPRTVQASHQDFQPLEKKLDVQPVSNQLDLVFEAGQEVSGRAVDREGKGIEGVQINLVLGESPRERDVLSSSDGSFTLLHVADGDYSIRAEKEGYATTETLEKTEAVHVAGAPVRDLEIRMNRGGRISGDLLGLDLYDLAEVTVTARREDGFEKPGSVDYSGHYEVAELPAGNWLVLGSLRNGQREAQARAVLEAGGEVTDADLEFGDSFTLNGRVLLGGEPLKDARVSLAGQDVAVRRMVESDWQGAFVLEDVEPGRYRLQVSASRQVASHSEDLTVDSDRDLLIDLGSTRFSGTVVDSSTSEGVPGAIVALRRLEGEEAAFLMTMGTDEDGYFVLPNVTEGRYRVTVTKDGYSPWEQTLQIQAGAAMEDQRIPLKPTTGLRLLPTLASGRRPPHVTGALRDGSGRIVLFETRPLDATGVASFPTAPPGEWEMLVSAPSGALASIQVKAPGEPVPVVLADAGRLTVRVPQLATSDSIAILTLADAEGKPFRNLSPYGTVQTQWQIVGGKAVVEGVPAGAWMLRAVTPDGRSWSGSTVTAARDTEVGLN